MKGMTQHLAPRSITRCGVARYDLDGACASTSRNCHSERDRQRAVAPQRAREIKHVAAVAPDYWPVEIAGLDECELTNYDFRQPSRDRSIQERRVATECHESAG